MEDEVSGLSTNFYWEDACQPNIVEHIMGSRG
jgi:hypothetical protein